MHYLRFLVLILPLTTLALTDEQPPDIVLFFKLFRALLSLVNERLQVIPDHLARPEEFLAVPPERAPERPSDTSYTPPRWI